MTPQSLRQILSAYPSQFTPQRWHVLGDAGGFSGAVIVRIETQLGAFALRGWPTRGMSAPRILGLHRLLKVAFESGVTQLAVPLASTSGETLVTRYGRIWQLEPWMPGKSDYSISPSQLRLQNTMACLAAFHRVTADYNDPGPARTWFFTKELAPSPAVTERLGYLQQWQPRRLAELQLQIQREPDLTLRDLAEELAGRLAQVAKTVGPQLEIMSHLRFQLQPCLRDVWHDHVLFSGEEVTGLIDASACRAENVATDLARLLGSFLKDDRSGWSLALEEYQRHRPLTLNELALIQALDQSGVLLSAMAWLDRLYRQKEQITHQGKLLERLRFLRDRLEHLERTVSQNLLEI